VGTTVAAANIFGSHGPARLNPSLVTTFYASDYRTKELYRTIGLRIIRLMD